MMPQTSHRLTRRTLLQRGVALPAVAAASQSPAPAGADTAVRSLAQPPANGVPDLVTGNTAFALDLYAALRQDEDLVPADGNLLLSPYSVSQALAMTYAGARGETAAQMAETLGFGLPQPALREAFAALTADLVARGNAADDPDTDESEGGLRIANALWGERTYPFSQSYNAQLEQDYGAGLHQGDFVNAAGETGEQINAWVAEQTEDRVQNVVPEGAITPLTRLVLANAIYFYGGWYIPFERSDTRDGEFFLLNGTTVTVPFMFRHGLLDYARGDGFQAIEFPYSGLDSGYSVPSGFVFTVILPDDGRVEEIESGLDANTLNGALGLLTNTEVLVYLPKFDFEFGTASLAETLRSMGMVDAFDPGSADFTGMVDGAPPEPLWIGDVLHKAFIGVDEDGTEAAAASGMAAPGAAPPAPEPAEVRIERPFLFAIRDTQTGTLLFLGRVTNPGA